MRQSIQNLKTLSSSSRDFQLQPLPPDASETARVRYEAGCHGQSPVRLTACHARMTAVSVGWEADQEKLHACRTSSSSFLCSERTHGL